MRRVGAVLAAVTVGVLVSTGCGGGRSTPTGPLLRARSSGVAATLPGGRVLVAGGGDHATQGPGPLADAEVWDPLADDGRGAFTATASLTTAREGAVAVTLADARVLVLGGALTLTGDLFDPAARGGAGAFQATRPAAHQRWQPAATWLLDGRVLVLGEAAEAELYLPDADGGPGTFVPAASLGTPRSGATAVRLPDGRVLVAGGRRLSDSRIVPTAELYLPDADGGPGTFVPAPDLVYSRDQAKAVHLGDGRVLYVGGTGEGGTSLAPPELFQPLPGVDGGAFVLLPSTLVPAADATVLALGEGRAVLLGGQRDGVVTGEVLVLDLPAGDGLAAFQRAEPLAVARTHPMAVPIRSGKVLVAGGLTTTQAPYRHLADAEVYFPPP